MTPFEYFAIFFVLMVSIGDHLHFRSELRGDLHLWIISRVGWEKYEAPIPDWFRLGFAGGALSLGYLTLALTFFHPLLGLAATGARIIADRRVIHLGLSAIYKHWYPSHDQEDWAPTSRQVAGTVDGRWQIPAGILALATVAVQLIAFTPVIEVQILLGYVLAVILLPFVIFGGFMSRAAFYRVYYTEKARKNQTPGTIWQYQQGTEDEE